MSFEDKIQTVIVAAIISKKLTSISKINQVNITKIITENINCGTNTLLAIQGKKCTAFQLNVGFDFNIVSKDFYNADLIYYAHLNHSNAFKVDFDLIKLSRAEKLANNFDAPLTKTSIKNLVDFHCKKNVAVNRKSILGIKSYFKTINNRIMLNFINQAIDNQVFK